MWGNDGGFPRTRLLILDGAADGDRFKRWSGGNDVLLGYRNDQGFFTPPIIAQLLAVAPCGGGTYFRSFTNRLKLSTLRHSSIVRFRSQNNCPAKCHPNDTVSSPK